MAALASARPEGFAAEIIEAAVADFRLRKINKERPLAPRGEAAAPQTNQNWRQKVDGVKAQRILYALDEGVSVADAAKRNGVSRTTVRRIQQNRDRNTNRTQVPRISSARGSRGASILFAQGERKP